MRPSTRRTAGTVAAALALGIPALAAGAVPGSPFGALGATDRSNAPRDVSSCDRHRLATSFVLAQDGSAMVEGIVVRGISGDCAGRRLAVVVGGTAGEAVAASPDTTVLLDRPVPASDVTTLTVSIMPAP